MSTYEELISEDHPPGGAPSLKSRLVRFRRWATKSAGIAVHSALCVVNGEATDGTRNAPVLVFDPVPRADPRTGAVQGGGGGGGGGGDGGGGGEGGGGSGPASEPRCGAVDLPSDRAMYDRSIGCQVRTVRELKKDEVALSIPASAMVTPDLIANSDAGRAVRACCAAPPPPSSAGDGGDSFWDALGRPDRMERAQAAKVQQNSGTQLLVKILQERKKAETALVRATRAAEEALQRGDDVMDDDATQKLASFGSVSRRAPYLAFLIHQRFANERDPPVAASSSRRESRRGGRPKTFAPYVRAFPPSVCVPLCWKRNELALLAGCIPGMPALQRVAARTMQLSAELLALVDAGLLQRFPATFSPGMITWDRWVWAAAAYESRMISAGALGEWVQRGSACPPDVWEGCGVLVPFLEMLNHEDNAARVQLQGTPPPGASSSSDSSEEENGLGRLDVITLDRTKKHMQVYRDYGSLDNEHSVLRYGFARAANPADRVRIAWSLVDGVGNVPPPPGHDPFLDPGDLPPGRMVYESSDPDAVRSWWTERRMALLGRATSGTGAAPSAAPSDATDSLRRGKKVTFCAYSDERIDPALVAAAVAATLPPERVAEFRGANGGSGGGKPLEGLVLDKACQNAARLYLGFLFAKKLGKLLQGLNSCLKDHFNSVQLWTKASEGGINYGNGADAAEGGGGGGGAVGWNKFFDTYAWYSTMEVEDRRYYSMAPDSCVLTLYDGHVRSLQVSLDVMMTDASFNEKVRGQLEELGCVMDDAPMPPAAVETPTAMDVQPVVTPSVAASGKDAPMDQVVLMSGGGDQAGKAQSNQPSPPKMEEQGNDHGNGKQQPQQQLMDARSSNSVASSNKGGAPAAAAPAPASSDPRRPPAIKLHIGNLSYKTMPAQLYDFFTRLYGRDSVLECHIPTERDTGNSRGFGFVTMPEGRARAALESGRRHEMDGRILKVAESNSAGSNRGRGIRNDGRGGTTTGSLDDLGVGGQTPAPSGDRCSQCGYRPRWCTCSNPGMPVGGSGGGGGPPAPPPQDPMYGMGGPYGAQPPPSMGGGPGGYGHHEADDRGRGGGDGYGRGGGDGYGGGGGLGIGVRAHRSYSRSPSYRRERDRDRGGYDRDRGQGGGRSPRSYSRSRSRSRSHSPRDRRRDRDRRGQRRGRHDDDREIDRRRGGRYDDEDRRRGGRLDRDHHRGSERRGSSRRSHRSRSRSRSPRRGVDDGLPSHGPRGRPADEDGGDFSEGRGAGGRGGLGSLSRSRSPMEDDGGAMMGDHHPTSKKRDGKDSGDRGGRGERSRSRDRGRDRDRDRDGRSGRRKRSSKGSRRDKGSSSSKRRSRSRSRDRHRN
ncbi:hypothetical protein ACHAWF_018782 [Thalassiosira exigua]